jgi:predicted DCC family thiol-disulfide oxidoreductase YuxK
MASTTRQCSGTTASTWCLITAQITNGCWRNLTLLLGGRFRVLGYLLGAVPAFLRNAAYALFARNRYRLTGRYEVCPLPTELERSKFLG